MGIIGQAASIIYVALTALTLLGYGLRWGKMREYPKYGMIDLVNWLLINLFILAMLFG